MRSVLRNRRSASLLLAVVASIVIGGCAGVAPRGSAPSSSASPSLPNPFTITARFSPSSLGLTHPVGLALGPDGNLYVTDRSQRAAVVSPEGKVLHRWGKAGAGPGEFSFLSGDPSAPSDVHGPIAVGPDGKIYISDRGNARIQIFSATGSFIRQFGSFGSGHGQFQAPFDLAVDGSGNVYVVDDTDESVSKFSPTGDFVWRVGGSQEKDQDLIGHEHLTSVDAHGRIVLANDANSKILYLDPKGRKVDVFDPQVDRTSEHGSCDVTVDPLGNTFVGTQCDNPGETLVFDRSHKLIGGWYSNNPLASPPRFGPNGEAFALGLDGTIFKLTIALPGRS